MTLIPTKISRLGELCSSSTKTMGVCLLGGPINISWKAFVVVIYEKTLIATIFSEIFY